MRTCRFCGVSEADRGRSLIKYGVRHYSHHACYITAGKRLEDLHDWQILQFPYELIKQAGLTEVAFAASIREERRKNGDGAARFGR